MQKKLEKLVETPKGVVAWLEGITDNVKPLDHTKVFKQYKPLDRGNEKLEKNILSFSLPSISTCGQYCKGCYDIKAMRHKSCRAKRYVNYSMAVHKMDTLKGLIIKQIKDSKSCEYVRIHVGGDFYSLGYVKMWKEIAEEVKVIKPDIIFYTYTKSMFSQMLKDSGINVVKSQYGDDYNYAPLKEVRELAKKHKGVLCPATVLKSLGKEVPSHYCGSECTACMFKERVFFVKH